MTPTDERPWRVELRALLALAVPVVIDHLGTMSMGLVDTIVVGLESPAQIDDLLARAEQALDHARSQRA